WVSWCQGSVLTAGSGFSAGRLSSTSSNSSCSGSDYGEVIPHHPGLPKSDPGQWWASFFFGKTNPPAMTTVSESPESCGLCQRDSLRVYPACEQDLAPCSLPPAFFLSVLVPAVCGVGASGQG
uniref:Pancreatic progenitor cell differentiation and proliferation factor n=1 Tax=Anas platyrhynchos TaxID=8839 RepID=A0A8B9ZH58_ANAPL